MKFGNPQSGRKVLLQMKKPSVTLYLLVVALICLMSVISAKADTVDVLVGDKNNFGFAGCTDTGTCANLGIPSIDNRTPAEMAATNGAQITDVYSAIFPTYGPNTTSTADVLFPFLGTLTSGTINLAAGDFQSDVFGAFTASIDGVSVPFFFADGRFVTTIHSFTLTDGQLAVANGQGFVDLHLDRNGSGDFVSFDWFELNGQSTTATPEPGTMLLLGVGVLGLAAVKLMKR